MFSGNLPIGNHLQLQPGVPRTAYFSPFVSQGDNSQILHSLNGCSRIRFAFPGLPGPSALLLPPRTPCLLCLGLGSVWEGVGLQEEPCLLWDEHTLARGALFLSLAVKGSSPSLQTLRGWQEEGKCWYLIWAVAAGRVPQVCS